MKQEIVIQEDLLKRMFDVFFSFFVLLLLSPLFLCLSLLIKFTSRGPVFYAQKRVGRGKKTFYCWKFRTMYLQADLLLEELLKNDPLLQKEWLETWKLKKDPRITWVGNFLRKTSLDELPQFWNVLKGDLSIVGPRPCVETELELHFKEKMEKILSLRPGITGLWQISGRNNLTYPERVRLEEQYVDTQNFWFDLQLIAKTILVIFSSKGAY
jgi:exopolysaccharide production protein ExoY